MTIEKICCHIILRCQRSSQSVFFDDTENNVSQIYSSLLEEATKKLCTVIRSGGFTVCSIEISELVKSRD